MAERVCVIGGFGGGVGATLDLDSGTKVVQSVVDDGPTELNLERLADRGVAYLGTLDSWLAYGDYGIPFILGVDDDGVRRELGARLESMGLRPFGARPANAPLTFEFRAAS